MQYTETQKDGEISDVPAVYNPAGRTQDRVDAACAADSNSVYRFGLNVSPTILFILAI
jgi:hypothetical protein